MKFIFKMSKGLQNALVALKSLALEEKELTTRVVWEAAISMIQSKENIVDGVHAADSMLFGLRDLAQKDGENELASIYKTMHGLFQVMIQRQLEKAGEDPFEFKTKWFY